MDRTTLAGIILAAGKGTRMKSQIPKALHPVCGVPMVELIGRAMRGAGVERPILVVGFGGDQVQEAFGDAYRYVWQHEQRGSGHAVRMAEDLIRGHEGSVLIAPGDTPLLTTDALYELAEEHKASGVDCTVATIRVPNPFGYGRIVRDSDGYVTEIVEHRDATEDQRKIDEINSAVYCFKAGALLKALPLISDDNKQKEFYLTDAIKIIRSQGGLVKAFLFDDPTLLIGVNDRWQLAEAAGVLRRRILRKHALSGVTIQDIDSIFIAPDVEIGHDTVVAPNTILEGNTTIGADCMIGPNTRITDSTIGNRCTVLMSNLNEATMLDGAKCGPFANLRPQAVLGENSRVGNFVEVKKSTLGEKVSVAHLSYIGDGEIGANTNIGAGTIFCNFDGFRKHRTEVGEGAFVGSNTTLVAPVTIGDGALIAAGSVITKSVPKGALGIGRGKQEEKEGWAVEWRKRNRPTDTE